MDKRTFLTMLPALGMGITLPGPAAAQAYPAKPIRVIVAFAAGGATDVLARSLSQQLTNLTGATVIVENKPGASGAIAMEFVARAPADGYTLLWGSDSVVVQPLLRKNFPVDPMKDLTPLARLGTAPMVISVGKKVAARDLKELVALAKATPGGLKYGSGGNGSMKKECRSSPWPTHLTATKRIGKRTERMVRHWPNSTTDCLSGSPLPCGGARI